jgi:hypothetical protein
MQEEATIGQAEESRGGAEGAVLEERHGVPPAQPRIDRRRAYLTATGLIAALGLWLIVSAIALNYGPGDATWTPIVSGTLIFAAAVAGLAGMLSRTASAWAVAAVAVWLFASGFWLAESFEASWNAWAGGALAFFLAIAAGAAGSAPRGR